jgi:hypothetical protein
VAQTRDNEPPAPRWRDLRPPLWLRSVLSLGVAAVLVTALIVFVDNNSSNGPANIKPAAAAEENREAEILVTQDQAPHVVRLSSGTAPASALAQAVRQEMASRIARTEINGPLKRSSCHPSGSRTGPRVAFMCRVVAGGVSYPFFGVVDVRARRLTYCKRDPPPIPSENIPISPRCLA